jgi:hypothetical protein
MHAVTNTVACLTAGAQHQPAQVISMGASCSVANTVADLVRAPGAATTHQQLCQQCHRCALNAIHTAGNADAYRCRAGHNWQQPCMTSISWLDHSCMRAHTCHDGLMMSACTRPCTRPLQLGCAALNPVPVIAVFVPIIDPGGSTTCSAAGYVAKVVMGHKPPVPELLVRPTHTSKLQLYLYR